MAIIRVLLLAFSVGVFTFLLYRLIQIGKTSNRNKGVILAAGVLLLILPAVMLLGFVRPSWHYLLLYPVAIALFLYLIKSQ
ncbi:MAG: hypothetical protein MUC38_01975 [Cyclobacteriaceae bacterium]|jgi:hypothetical protein|nr:hypothetical protein [Cyclobacteriaceae bacterium]